MRVCVLAVGDRRLPTLKVGVFIYHLTILSEKKEENYENDRNVDRVDSALPLNSPSTGCQQPNRKDFYHPKI